MMKPISEVDRVLLAMRAQAMNAARDVKRAKTSAQSAPGGDSSKATSDPVDDLIAQIRSIDSQDPQRPRRIFRALIESKAKMLFGVEALGDATFQVMFEQVLRFMEQDGSIASGMQRATALLSELTAEPDQGGPLRAALDSILIFAAPG